MRYKLLTLAFCLIPLTAQTLRLHPANPHYYEWRGRPVVLITSAEHYGAVLNLDFDQRKYLDALAKDKLNLTRIFSGAYREFAEDFGITNNTLAPKPDRYITPWSRNSGGEWDLTRWNPAFFERLRDFVREADKRGIVVEMTLFTAYYDAKKWKACPLYAENNVNGVGKVEYTEALTLKDPALVKAEETMVRKFVTELNEFDNVYFEICNEPYFAGVALDWQRRIAEVIVETEKSLPKKHLIAQNIANVEGVVKEPFPQVSIFNFHYARPPAAVAQNRGLKRVIGFDESGFDGTADFVYRIQGWDFLHAGGAHYNNLDYSFTVGHEDGSFLVPGTAPGGGSPSLRKQLGNLVDHINALDFTKTAPADNVVVGGVPAGASVRVLAEPGKQYAIYVQHVRILEGVTPRYVVATGRQTTTLRIELPAGKYAAQWVNPRTGAVDAREEFEHAGGARPLASPPYNEDIALRILAR